MAWIESHQELGRHPKTKRLARLLGVSIPAAVGHLHFLWWWALDFAPDGILDKYDSYDIAEAMAWDGDEEKLLDALIDCGYIDVLEDHGWVIHDWGEYAGKLLERRAKDRARKRAAAENAGVPPAVRGSSDGTDAEGAESRAESLVTNQPTVPTVPTVPNQPTVPTGGNESAAAAAASPSAAESPETEGKPVPMETPPADATPYTEIVAMYHEICKSYPRLRTISVGRKRSIAARWKEYKHNLDAFRELFTLAEASTFLKGKNDRNWSADFNWLMESDNMAKVLERKFNNSPKEVRPNAELRGNPARAEYRDSGGETTLSGFRMAGC